MRDIASTLVRAALPIFRRSPDGRLTLPADRVPWTVRPVPDHVVAIGDLQGDLVALASILHDRSLVDEEGGWIGGPVHVVLNGDLVGNHGDSRLLMEFVIRLEDEAQAAGGAVHALLGNHDILSLSHPSRRIHRAGIELLEKYAVPGADSPDSRDAFRGHTPYAQWLRGRNTILRIGDTLFAHAGVNEWLHYNHPGRVNSTIRAWIRYWQGIGIKPDDRTAWTVGQPQPQAAPEQAPESREERPFRPLETGPLWSRAYKPPPKRKQAARKPPRAPDRETLAAILRRYGAKRLVIGHNPVNGREVQLEHPYYEDMLVMIDARISGTKSGALSWIELSKDQIGTRSCRRTKAGLRIRRMELRRLKKQAAPA